MSGLDFESAGTGLSALGHLFSGFGGLAAGQSQQEADRYAAAQARAEAGVQAQIALTEGNAAVATAATQAAANGGGLTGSSIGLIQSLSEQAMFNARSAAYRGATISQRDLYEGRVAAQQGADAALGGVIGAAGTEIGGMASDRFRKQQLQELQRLRGLGAASPYDYAAVN